VSHTCGGIVAHIEMNEVCRKSCHTYGGVMTHIQGRHVTYMEESCLTDIEELRHNFGCMRYVARACSSASHVTHMQESCHT